MTSQCRHCGAPLVRPFADLGFAPPSNAYLSAEDLKRPETTYPLRTYVCTTCWLVQTEDYADSGEIFNEDYAYFSSISTGWLKHAAEYCQMITQRLRLDSGSHVIEVASNDGYLLKNFTSAGVPCLGIEPTASTAQAARALGIEVLEEFFSFELACNLKQAGKSADLIVGNNVYAHVPDINDFTAGLAAALKPEGVITLEFPHLLQLLEFGQFDTIYHEHFSYLSLVTVQRIFRRAGLRIFDVEELTTHGGSLRIYGCMEDSSHVSSPAVDAILDRERSAGLEREVTYRSFQERTERTKARFLEFLLSAKGRGETVAAYGAAAKGNTLLNYAGIRPDLISVAYDAAPSKQGKYLPGSHIPVLSPEKIPQDKPDWLLILPWNIADEIIRQHNYVRDWGCKFAVAIPEFKVLP
ncbi:MAG: class I SAM-dependent methyltransferase [Pseudomonadota bacterium]